jgi:hypothetical protein
MCEVPIRSGVVGVVSNSGLSNSYISSSRARINLCMIWLGRGLQPHEGKSFLLIARASLRPPTLPPTLRGRRVNQLSSLISHTSHGFDMIIVGYRPQIPTIICQPLGLWLYFCTISLQTRSAGMIATPRSIPHYFNKVFLYKRGTEFDGCQNCL